MAERIWTKNGTYEAVSYANEADLESSIVEVQQQLFGANRIYLDIKRKIGAKGGIRNIPDGYLIDLNGSKPRLFVVENELAAHDPLRHIAVQILQFSLSFESEPITIKKFLLEALSDVPEVKAKCEAYAAANKFRNLDHLLESLVFEGPFAALAIIDEVPDNLENILAKRFQFGVEVLQLVRYENTSGERFYHFEPFLADVVPDVPKRSGDVVVQSEDLGTIDLDTVVVPAREEGFKEVFLGEDRWYAVRIHGSMRPQIKYIAGYQVAPVRAITHLAPVKSIEPWKDSGKVVVNFTEPAKEISPVRILQNGQIKSFQNLRYTTKERLETAKSLDDLWVKSV